VFDFLTTVTGLYARALLPNLRDPVFAFPEVARITLPPFALGLFYLAMIATVMSTIDSYGFIAATTIARDVLWRVRRGAEDRIPAWTRLGLWLTAAFAAGLAIAKQSVIALWHDIGSVITPTLLLPVGAALLGRFRLGARWTMAAMLLPFGASLGWIVAKSLRPQAGYPFGIEPIYIGLGVSLLAYAAGHLMKERTT